jgi:hypothetical protein
MIAEAIRCGNARIEWYGTKNATDERPIKQSNLANQGAKP